MTINSGGPEYQVWVCKPGQDETTGLEVTAACSGESGGYFSASDEQLDESGILRTRGELVLVEPTGWEGESFDPWLNPSRWSIGNHIVVFTANESGVLTRYPRSGLFIVADPEPPTQGRPELRLELVDQASFRSTRSPAGDDSGIELGTETDRFVAVQNLMEAAGADFDEASLLAIEGGTVSAPLNRTSNQGAISQAGAIAISGRAFLWANSNGVIEAEAINLYPVTPLFTQTIGVDDVGGLMKRSEAGQSEAQRKTEQSTSGSKAPGRSSPVTPIQGAERPAKKVRATGTTISVKARTDSGSSEGESYTIAEAIKEGAGSGTVLAGTTRESWAWTTATFQRTVQASAARGLILSDGFFEELGLPVPATTFSLRPSQFSREVKYYESSPSGKLKRELTTSQLPKGQLLQEYYRNNPPQSSVGLLTLITGYRQETEYDYTGEQLRQVTTRIYKLKGEVAGAADNWSESGAVPTILIPFEINTTTWIKHNPDEWERHEVVQRAGRVNSGTVASISALGTVSDTRTRSRDGSCQPPSPDRRPPPFYVEEKIETSDAQSSDVGGELESTYQFDYLNSSTNSSNNNEQLEKLAGIFLSIRKARHQGFRIISHLRNELFQYSPLRRVDVEWGATTQVGLIDIATWTLAADQAIVVLDCMRVGSYATADPSKTIRPVIQLDKRFSGGMGMGGGVRVILGDRTATFTDPMPGGIGTGAANKRPMWGGMGMGGKMASNSATGTLIVTIIPNYEENSEIWVYYNESPFPSDLAGLPRQVYLHGTDYSSSMPLNVSSFLQTHGVGYYAIAIYHPTIAPFGFWGGYLAGNYSVEPEGGSIEGYDSAGDSAYGIGSNGFVTVQLIDPESATTFDLEITSGG